VPEEERIRAESPVNASGSAKKRLRSLIGKRIGSERVRFLSTCPVCGEQQLQLAYTRRALLRLLENANIIDAYCLACDVVWPVNVQERNLVAAAIAAGQLGATATGRNYAAPLP